ncbi:MAG: sugar transferase [Candidatus Acidiferrales bacterium]
MKRGIDLAIAFLGMLALVPVFALIVIASSLDSPGPAFFGVRVAGQDGKPFRQWKFRTMLKNARQQGHPFETSSSDPRITRMGHILRRWSLDELPQLWNVLRGDMSLVGPRPTFVEVAALYSPGEARRLQMRPGLTGLAQIQGRNLLSWPQRIALDLLYIEHYSLWADCKILFRTIPFVLRGEGIYGKEGRVRMHDLA